MATQNTTTWGRCGPATQHAEPDVSEGLPKRGPRGRKRWLAALAAWAGTSAFAGTVTVEVADATGKPLSDAVVFLESSDARKLVRPMPAQEIAQEKRQFLPGVLAITVGTEVQFPNRDSIRHHVYSFSPAKKFELKLYTGRPANPVVFDQPGVVVLGCNIHDQMVGWVVVVDTPYLGQSSASGQASLTGVSPGTYKLRSWHARLPVGAPAQEQSLVVPPSGDVKAVVRMAGLAP
ncbi:methylamine utilization protein [Acidovorax lacteus]|uniref:Methylamine utilization protein n=1 Tax=Acidovorax lacteus TaxID=1924988 RepID=A0ABP8LAT1_9BURK